MATETEIALLSSRQDAQGRRLDTLEQEHADIERNLMAELPALRTEVRLMTDSFRAFRNALFACAGVIVAGSATLLITLSGHLGG